MINQAAVQEWSDDDASARMDDEEQQGDMSYPPSGELDVEDEEEAHQVTPNVGELSPCIHILKLENVKSRTLQKRLTFLVLSCVAAKGSLPPLPDHCHAMILSCLAERWCPSNDLACNDLPMTQFTFSE